MKEKVTEEEIKKHTALRYMMYFKKKYGNKTKEEFTEWLDR